jgi:S1-C subfamily serine protease
MSAPHSRFMVWALLALGLVLFYSDNAQAQPKKGEPGLAIQLPAVFGKEQPESVDDLKAMEAHVEGLLKKISPAVVGIRFNASQGSGVIVNKEGYVLTAGHVSGVPDRDVTIILPNGKQLKGKTLGKNGTIDSGMVKIVEAGEWPYAEMGKSADLKKGQWVLAIGHPAGFRVNRTPVVRLGRVLFSHSFVLRTDCVIVGGDSGGPLFDMTGKVIGIHSRIGTGITENLHIPIDTYHQTWHRLAKGDSWGGPLGQQMVMQSAGGNVLCEINGRMTADDPKDRIMSGSYCQTHFVRMTPDFAYTIEMYSPNGKQLDPYLRVENSAGMELAEDDDSAGNLNSRIVFRPAVEDTYRIIATTFDPGQTGPYKVVVRQAPLYTGKVAVLPAVRIPTDFPLLLLQKVLATAGKPVFAGAVLFDAKGRPAGGKQVQFRWDKGETKVIANEYGALRLPLTRDKLRGLAVEIPQGINVALELTDQIGNPTALNLAPEFAKEMVKSAGGKLVFQTEAVLTDKEPLDPVRKKCYCRTHPIRIAAGSIYTIDLASTDFNAYLRLEDPSGKQVAEDDDGAGQLNSRIVFAPEAEGVYRAIVTTCDPQENGSYRLSVFEAEGRKVARRV